MAEPDLDPSVFYGEHRDDPYPTLKRLRDHHPVYRLPDGRWILTRYDDVVAAFKDSVHYSNRVYRHTIDAVFGVTLMEYARAA